MKKRFYFFIILCNCPLILSMGSYLTALQTAQYYRDYLKDQPLGFLPNVGSAETRDALRNDAQTKYDLLTQEWKSNCASPLKPFEQCTWNDIEAAYNGDSSRLVNPFIPPARY